MCNPVTLEKGRDQTRSTKEYNQEEKTANREDSKKIISKEKESRTEEPTKVGNIKKIENNQKMPSTFHKVEIKTHRSANSYTIINRESVKPNAKKSYTNTQMNRDRQKNWNFRRRYLLNQERG